MFRVPEQYRDRRSSDASFGNNGKFYIPAVGGVVLQIIASDGEEWRPIRGYEDLYEISNCGSIRAFAKTIKIPNGGERHHEETILTQGIKEGDYRRVTLKRDGEPGRFVAHRLVAEAFIPNPKNFPTVNHRDGNKANNVVTNLEWCTEEYNHHHAIENGLQTGFKMEEIEQIRQMILEGQSSQQIADIFGKSRQTIGDIKGGRIRAIPEPPTGYDGIAPWEHVSVTILGQDRCPVWDEMCFVKDFFWSDEDTVIQFHPARSEYVTTHPYCLHLWRPVGVALPKPDPIQIGIRNKQDTKRLDKWLAKAGK